MSNVIPIGPLCAFCGKPPPDKYQTTTLRDRGRRLHYCDPCILERYPSVLHFLLTDLDDSRHTGPEAERREAP